MKTAGANSFPPAPAHLMVPGDSGFTMADSPKIRFLPGGKYGSGRAGFTLIELTVVIVILSVVALLVIPRLPIASERDLRTSARTLAATLRYLGNLAIADKNRYRLRISLIDRDMTVTRVIQDGDEVAVTDAMLKRLSLREGVEVADVVTSRLGTVSAGGEAVLNFTPLGAEEFTVIHLKSGEKPVYYTVALYPGSGRVSVLEGYQEGTLPGDDEGEKAPGGERETVR